MYLYVKNKMNESSSPKIKGIVLSGGGPIGFSMYGILRESNKNGFWKMDEIEQIYGTSVGAVIGLMISLKYDWDTLDEYLINRPWQNIFKFDMYSLINSIQKKGIFDKNILIQIFAPLFNGMDIPIDITMADFYEKTKIEHHFYTSEINESEIGIIDISHKSHPEWIVIDAVYASCCLPILFSPLQMGEKCYIDGGICNNYPIKNSIENGLEKDEIFGIGMEMNEKQLNKIEEKSTLFDYMVFILYKLMSKIVSNEKEILEIKYEIKIKNSGNLLYDILNATSSKEERIRLINSGCEECSKLFMN